MSYLTRRDGFVPAQQPKIEQEIFERIKATKLRLQFDKVVQRLVGYLRER
jgi:hypothetical protein